MVWDHKYQLSVGSELTSPCAIGFGVKRARKLRFLLCCGDSVGVRSNTDLELEKSRTVERTASESTVIRGSVSKRILIALLGVHQLQSLRDFHFISLFYYILSVLLL